MKATIKYKGNGLKPLPFPIIIIPHHKIALKTRLPMSQRRCYNLFPNTKMGRGSFGQGLNGFIKGTKSTEQCD